MLAINVQTFLAPSRIFVPDDRHARAQLHQPLGIGRRALLDASPTVRSQYRSFVLHGEEIFSTR
jgi:hypothetical protein